jgi:hypothetical protein
MLAVVDRYIADLITACPQLQAVYDDCIKYWLPEEPPITTLFGEFGTEILAEYGSLDDNRKQILFRVIEDGMNSEDTELRTAVATGLLEAIANPCDPLSREWSAFRSQLGFQSRSYVDAWFAFWDRK